MLKSLLCVFLGGGIGSVLRYTLSLVITVTNGAFPLATLTANLIGSFAIGAFYAISSKLGWPQDIRLLLTTGLCGGFTTFSTLTYESYNLLRNQCYTTLAIYIIASILLGAFMVWLGATLTAKI